MASPSPLLPPEIRIQVAKHRLASVDCFPRGHVERRTALKEVSMTDRCFLDVAREYIFNQITVVVEPQRLWKDTSILSLAHIGRHIKDLTLELDDELARLMSMASVVYGNQSAAAQRKLGQKRNMRLYGLPAFDPSVDRRGKEVREAMELSAWSAEVGIHLSKILSGCCNLEKLAVVAHPYIDFLHGHTIVTIVSRTLARYDYPHLHYLKLETNDIAIAAPLWNNLFVEGEVQLGRNLERIRSFELGCGIFENCHIPKDCHNQHDLQEFSVWLSKLALKELELHQIEGQGMLEGGLVVEPFASGNILNHLTKLSFMTVIIRDSLSTCVSELCNLTDFRCVSTSIHPEKDRWAKVLIVCLELPFVPDMHFLSNGYMRTSRAYCVSVESPYIEDERAIDRVKDVLLADGRKTKESIPDNWRFEYCKEDEW